jgi:hypothetical protein
VTFTGRTFTSEVVGGFDDKGQATKLPGGDAIAIGDFDGDGLDDIAIANPSGISVFKANAKHP